MLGYPPRFFQPSKVPTISSSSYLSTNAARCFYFLSSVIQPSFIGIQEIAINTTGKEIKEGKEGLPPLRNPPLLETADDLATLSHLNEPSGVYLMCNSTFLC
jgi:hypothetical protein